jgi:hypothetical protein
MQGSMKTDRSTIRTARLAWAVALMLSAAAPLAAHAGPLLSGYGGPGQGNQAILGSTLLGGAGGGASGSGGPGGPSSQAPAPNGGATAGAAHSGTRHSSRAAHPASGTGAGERSGHPRAGGLASGSYPAMERTASSGTFGLSGADIFYVVLAAAALAFAGVLTRRVARPRAARGH